MTDTSDKLFRQLKTSDRILFAAYVLCYLLFFQNDLERHVHDLINDGSIAFRPFLLSVFFTCILVASELLLSRIKLFRNVWSVCDFIPSALLLGAATSYNETYFVGYSLQTWCIIIVVSVLAMVIARLISVGWRNRSNLRAVCLNLFLMLVVMLIPVCIGNTDAAFHRTLRSETLNLMLRDKDVAGFERRIMNVRRYPDSNVSSWSDDRVMPDDYMQALLMRNYQNAEFVRTLKSLYPEQTDSTLRLYKDYLSVKSLGEESLDSLTAMFGGTYWFYYDY